MTDKMIKKFFALCALCLFAELIFAQTQWQDHLSSFVDSRDGRWYQAILMPDGKTWMAQNLNFETVEESRCYSNDVANCEIYGRLYDFHTAMTVCPAGWRLPSNDEWGALINAIGGSATAGVKLKARKGWQNNSNGTDNFGFSALPGGVSWGSGSFTGRGILGVWWTASEHDATSAIYRSMDDGGVRVNSHWSSRTRKHSVRCVRDD